MLIGDFVIPPLCSNTGGDLAGNHVTSAFELYQFCEDPPESYFAYVVGGALTTWMGEKLGVVTWRGHCHHAFGTARQNVRVRAVNGHVYSGTYYVGSGDYARIRRVKARPA